ncbi:hypothetical protein LCGC14_2317050, partial [marine sediment metagenome]
ILWNDDFVPIGNFDDTLLNQGCANMIQMYWGAREQMALSLIEHDDYSGTEADIKSRLETRLGNIINEYGAGNSLHGA